MVFKKVDIIYLDNRIHTDILSCILPELDSMLLQFASATFPPQKIHTSFNGNLVTTLSLSFSLTFSSQFLSFGVKQLGLSQWNILE